MTFLGATYYPWARLSPIPWLKVAVLVNPLVYMSEGFRMALTPVPHMGAGAIYLARTLGVTRQRREHAPGQPRATWPQRCAGAGGAADLAGWDFVALAWHVSI